MCSDNVAIENPGKYIDTVGEHIKMVVNDVASDLFGNSVGGAVSLDSDVPLQGKTVPDACDHLNAGIGTTHTSNSDRKSSSIDPEPKIPATENLDPLKASEIITCSNNADLFCKSRFCSDEVSLVEGSRENSVIDSTSENVPNWNEPNCNILGENNARGVPFQKDCNTITRIDEREAKERKQQYEPEESDAFVMVKENGLKENLCCLCSENVYHCFGNLGTAVVINQEFEV